jgi:hypothetical protein
MCSVLRHAKVRPSMRAAANCHSAITVAAEFTRLPQNIRTGTPVAKRQPYMRALACALTVVWNHESPNVQ